MQAPPVKVELFNLLFCISMSCLTNGHHTFLSNPSFGQTDHLNASSSINLPTSGTRFVRFLSEFPYVSSISHPCHVELHFFFFLSSLKPCWLIHRSGKRSASAQHLLHIWECLSKSWEWNSAGGFEIESAGAKVESWNCDGGFESAWVKVESWNCDGG